MHFSPCLRGVVLLLVIPLSLHPEVVAVNSVVFNGYARTRRPDGSFAPEHYVFGEGGASTRPVADSAMAKLTFPRVAALVAPPLANAGFLPVPSGSEPALLILVYWGATLGSSGHDPSQSTGRAVTAIANQQRAAAADPNHDPTKPVDANSAEGADYEATLWMLGLSNEERAQLDDRAARILGCTEAVSRAPFLTGFPLFLRSYKTLGFFALFCRRPAERL